MLLLKGLSNIIYLYTKLDGIKPMQDIFEKRKRHGYRQKEISLIDIFIHSYKVMTTLRKKYENTEE